MSRELGWLQAMNVQLASQQLIVRTADLVGKPLHWPNAGSSESAVALCHGRNAFDPASCCLQPSLAYHI